MSERSAQLRKLSNEKLIDVVKNYRQYGYEENLRSEAIRLLEKRGISQERLKAQGHFENHRYQRALEVYRAYCRSSHIALVAYLATLTFGLVLPYLVVGWHSLGWLLGGFWISFICYFVFLIISTLRKDELYDMTHLEKGPEWLNWLVTLVWGLPFYFFVYFQLRSQMKEALNHIR